MVRLRCRMSFGRASALLPFRRPRSHAILTAATLPLSSARHSPLRRPVLVCQHSRLPPTPAHCTALTSRRHMPRHLSCVTHLTHAALSWPQHAHSTPCSSPCDAICCYRADTAAHSSSSLNAAPVLRHTNHYLLPSIAIRAAEFYYSTVPTLRTQADGEKTGWMRCWPHGGAWGWSARPSV